MDLDITYKIIIALLMVILAIFISVQYRKIQIQNKNIKLTLLSLLVTFLLAFSLWLFIGSTLALLFYIMIFIWPLTVIFYDRTKKTPSNNEQ